MADHAHPELRLGRIEQQHLPALAAVHLAAFPDGALSLLGGGAVQRYYHALWGCSLPILVGAFDGDRLVGFACGGLVSGGMRRFLRGNVAYLALRLALRPWLLGRAPFRRRVQAGLRGLAGRPLRSGASRSPGPRSARRVFRVLAIGVHPSWEGMGVGTMLMSELERIARLARFDVMELTVAERNSRALCFYARIGWVPSAALGDHRRFERPLERDQRPASSGSTSVPERG